MPLPIRRKGEERSKFVSRCIKDLTDKGEGEDAAQRAAICHSRAENCLTDAEMSVFGSFWKRAQGVINSLFKQKKE